MKINKSLTMLLVLCVTTFVCATSAFADYTITVPQNVTLTSSATGTGTYSGTASVKISGNIEDGEQLYVSTPSTLTMSDGHKNVDATVNTSSKTVWNKDEVAAGQAQNNYNISARLTPGTWTGTETFYVSAGKTYNIMVGDNSVSLISSNENISHLKFKSDDDTVASVDSTGHLIGNGIGTTNIVKTVYDSTGGKILYTTTYTIGVTRKLTVIYDANGSTFTNGSKQNTVVYGFANRKLSKVSKTENVSDDGTTHSGGYGNNRAVTDTVTIPGAEQLAVTITYATESVSYDWVCVYDKSVTPSATNYSSSVSGKLGGKTKTTKTFTISGDTVQFFFRSDSSVDSYFGYYAVVEGTGTSNFYLSGSYEEPSQIADGMHLEGWYTDASCTYGNEFDLDNVSDSVNVITVYAKWEENYIAKGDTGGVSWKLYQTGLLRIYPTNGISGTMDKPNYLCNEIIYYNWYPYHDDIKFVVFDDGVKANSSLSHMFSFHQNIQSIDFGSFDTSNVTDMSFMFTHCNKLTDLNVSGFDTGKVTDMSDMFLECSNLTTLDVSGFDTSNVTNMDYMFSGCSRLTTLDVSGFDTSNVTNMGHMFRVCSRLTTLDVSNFDTSKVTNMNYMFGGCYSLTTLDVSGFDTGKVTDMSGMFLECSNLTTLDVSGFDTSNVTNMNYMFYNCSNLTTLDVSGFDTSNVTNMGGMFSGCSSLTTLDVSNFDTSKVTNMNYMFYNCSNLTTLDVSGFDTSNVTNMGYMFSGCSSLTTLDVSGFDTSNVTNMGYMFSGCSRLTTLDVSGFDTGKVTDMSGMFYNCSHLTTLNVSNFNTAKVTNMHSMFAKCNELTSITVGKDFATANLPNAGWNTGLFYVFTKTNLEIKGDASDALKAYNFTRDNRTVTFVASTQNAAEEASMIADDTQVDESKIVASSIDASESETTNKSKTLTKDTKNPIFENSTDDELTEVDGNSDMGQNSSQTSAESVTSDLSESKADDSASADTDSADDSEGSNSTLEPSSDDLYYPDSAAA